MHLIRELIPEPDEYQDIICTFSLENWAFIAKDVVADNLTRSLFFHKEGVLVALTLLNDEWRRVVLLNCPAWDLELLDRMYWLIDSDAWLSTYRLVSREPLEIVQAPTVRGTETTSLPDPS